MELIATSSTLCNAVIIAYPCVQAASLALLSLLMALESRLWAIRVTQSVSRFASMHLVESFENILNMDRATRTGTGRWLRVADPTQFSMLVPAQ